MSDSPEARAGSPSVSIYQMAPVQAPALRLDGCAVLHLPIFARARAGRRWHRGHWQSAGARGRGSSRELEVGTFFILKFATLTCQVEVRAVLISGCSRT